ncbi:hypothetical protein QZJ86_01985 [Methylomonas montana]|uniref:hypothetical protein n=1 Tax=Methylomonas montana TaxID=3058963 RepID=UPI002658B881|nr:hypothetical protein [Methylomonas montana]WKJ90918.1 hypothetical protein QZJ86_01985 [Methylomonas montana]
MITKDTLTSVERCFKKSNDHSRSQSIRLSGASQTLYENEFPKHLNYIQRIFEFYGRQTDLEAVLIAISQSGHQATEQTYRYIGGRICSPY